MILLAAGYPEPERAESHWARGYLNFAIDQGFLVRYQDITDLDVNMTRGMLAKLAANALGLSDPGTYGTFTDTDSVYVEALYAAGIVGGYPDGTYRPDASVSRAEIAAIVNRIYQSFEPVVPTDPDQDPTEITLRTTEQMIDFIKQKEGFRKEPTGTTPSIPSATAAPAARTTTPTASRKRRQTFCCVRCCRVLRKSWTNSWRKTTFS